MPRTGSMTTGLTSSTKDWKLKETQEPRYLDRYLKPYLVWLAHTLHPSKASPKHGWTLKPTFISGQRTKEFENYGDTDKDVLEAEFFSLSNGDCRHCQVIDLVDEQGLKWLKELKDVPGFKNLNWFTHYGLKSAVTKFSHRSPELSLTLKDHMYLFWLLSCC